MKHKWDGPKKKSATCLKCGLFRKVSPYLLKRPVFGNRVGRKVRYLQRGEMYDEMPRCTAGDKIDPRERFPTLIADRYLDMLPYRDEGAAEKR